MKGAITNFDFDVYTKKTNCFKLQLSPAFDAKSLYFKGESVEWHRPVTLEELLQLKSQYPDAKIVVGNSEVGKPTFNILSVVPRHLYTEALLLSFQKICRFFFSPKV